MPSTSRITLVTGACWLLLTIVVAACAPRHGVSAGARIAVGAEDLAEEGPFRIVYAGPKGEDVSPAEITLAFSRAVRPSANPALVIRLHDASNVEGEWHWFGDRTAIFVPTGGFRDATAYRVTIDEHLLAVDGSALAPIPPFELSTPRPALSSATYEFDEEHQLHFVDLDFTSSIAGLERAVRIEGRAAGGRRESIRYSIAQKDDHGPSHQRLEVDPSVARLEDVQVIASDRLTSGDGPLTSGRENKVKLDGVGPLKVDLYCGAPGGDEPKPIGKGGKCTLDASSVELRFTKAVKPKDVARLLSVTGHKMDKEFLENNTDPIETVDVGSFAKLEPGRKYHAVLASGVTSKDKDRITTERVFDFETTEHSPWIGWKDIRDREEVAESARPSIPLAVHSINVPSLEIIQAPIDEARLFDLLAAGRPDPAVRDGHGYKNWTLAHDASWVRGLPGSSSKRMTPTEKPSDTATSKVDLTAKSGFFAVGYVGAGLPDDVRVISVTDLGVATKWSPHGGHVWVTRLSNGSPVVGAQVSLRRVTHGKSTEVLALTADANGIARIPGSVASTFLRPPLDVLAPEPADLPEAVVVVHHDDDTAYARLAELDPSLAVPIGDAFTDRGLYRPGESAHVKGYFRMPSPRGLLTPAGRAATVEAIDHEEHAFFSSNVTLDAFGAFSVEIPIPKTIRLGRAHVRARLGTPPRRIGRRPDWRDSWPAYARLQIDEFRTQEIELAATLDREEYMATDKALLRASGIYLSGGALGHATVKVSADLTESRFAPKGLEGYTVHAADLELATTGKPRTKSVFKGELKLDSSGKLELPLALGGLDGSLPRSLRAGIEVEDVTKVFSYWGGATAIVHVADTYLGVRWAPRSELVAGKKARAEVMATDTTGTPRSITAKIEVLRWRREDNRLTPTSFRCTVKTTPGSCEIPLDEEGRFFLQASGVDGTGKPITSAFLFFVSKPAPPPKVSRSTPMKPEPAPERALGFAEECARPLRDADFRSLVVEKEDLTVGDSVRLCLRAYSEDYKNLFTFEREGVLKEELMTLGRSGRLVEIPATDELFPNVTFGLHQVRGRNTQQKPVWPGAGLPSASGESREVGIAAPKKKLTLKVETRGEYRPGDVFEAKVRVTDDAGRPAPSQVTVWAVDEGVLALVPHPLPLPEETFAQRRRTDVLSSDTRDRLFYEKGGGHMVKSPSLRGGATSVSDRSLFGRSVFRPTAFFLPNVVTGADGIATVRAKLPENLTRWKLFAVAATAGDLFGGAEATFKTNKPLMARPALPRFLRTGDRFDATVVVSSLDAMPSSVKLSMAASGVLGGSSSTSTTIPANGNVALEFPVEARAVGSGKVTFHVEGPPGSRDDVTIEEDVKPVLAIESRVIAGELNDLSERIDEGLGDLSRARPDVGGLDWRVSTTPLVGLAESLRDLVEYPYGCTEQLSSRLVPLIRLRTLSRELGVALPSDVDGRVRSALQTLLTHQRGDGGFGFWHESRKSEPLFTVLALGALHAASTNGYVVPESAVDRALGYLDPPPRKEAKTPAPTPTPPEEDEASDLASHAMLEDLLASMGRGRPAKLRALASDKTLPLFARALVAHGLAKSDPALARQILVELLAKASVTRALATFSDESTISARRTLSSPERTTAMVLRALVAIEPRHPILPKVVRGLLSQRRGGRWSTTQASAWAIGALDDARAIIAPRAHASTAEVLFANSPVGKARFTGAPGGESISGTIAINRLLAAPGAGVSFIVGDGGPLYYEGALRYSRSASEATALDHGFHVARRFQKLETNGRLTTPEAFAVGDYVIAEVMVVTDVARDLVVVDDPIPAGLEAVNTSFANVDTNDNRGFVADPSRALVTHRELRDDRVVTFFDELPIGAHLTRYPLRVIARGRFVTPPARAECMYAPDVYGRTGTTWMNTK